MNPVIFSQILPHSGSAGNVVKFTTCGTDGIIALWDLKVGFLNFLEKFHHLKVLISKNSGNNRVLSSKFC